MKIAAVLPILLGIIGFFALKALVFGKLALLIAGVMAFQKYGSASAGGYGKMVADPSGGGSGYVKPAADAWGAAAWPASGSDGGYYRRSALDATAPAAQQMAYNGQIQPAAA